MLLLTDMMMLSIYFYLVALVPPIRVHGTMHYLSSYYIVVEVVNAKI
jgi:hypothetical protein